MFKSVYGQQFSELVNVDAKSYAPFIIQKEKLVCGTILDVAYTKDGYYVGGERDANTLVLRGIIEGVQPLGGTTCCIGYNPLEEKWHGWSHRAIYGFGIGSSVEKGDCAYTPVDIEDFNSDMMSFWDVDNGIWRECESPDITCTTQLVSIESNVTEDDQLGTLLVTNTIFRGADRNHESRHFQPYPKVWGRGTWIAETLDDAKQMAMNFARGVN